ncbi:GUstatory Receptor family [Ditylenchus destructor]|uniref:GUstatory Receptor family n=1 Tax=Ditylenchus destructor TaxID=166010 RepID=A0AAD4MVV2_9BILA|nr:GUstatory Receptor family [Ditylenchus destructor]
MTGLYYGNLADRTVLCRYLVLSRTFLLYAITSLYTCRSLYRIFLKWSNHSINPMEGVDLEYLVMCGWQFQSVMSMTFLLYWQYHGVTKFIIEHIVVPKAREGKCCPVYVVLRRTMIRWLMIAILMTSCFGATICVDNVQKILLSGKSIFEPMLGLHPLDFLYRTIAIYGIGVWNFVLCFFVVVIRSLSLELRDFNRVFADLLRDKPLYSLEVERKSEKLAEKLLLAFAAHNRLAKKIRKTDKCFQSYTFAMMAVGTPMTIFALITLIRRKSWMGLLYSVHDVICCTVHLIGFTVVPAGIYTEFRAIQTQLYKNTAIWKEYNLKLYQIARMFTENVSQSDIGISIGGFITITKSLVLTCLSLVIPYVILCLQLNIGASNTLYRSVNNSTI